MPPLSSLHIDTALTNLSVLYRNTAYVADMVLPVVGVTKRSDKFFKYTKKDRFTLPSTLAGPKAEANEAEWAVETDNYSVLDYALKEFVSNEEVQNADAPITPRADATEFLTDLILLDREKRVADLVRDTAVLTQNTTLAGAAQWSDYGATSDPLGDIETGRLACFLPPTDIVIPEEVMSILKYHPDLIERVKYTSRDSVTPEMLAGLIGIPNVHVPKSKVNSANPGQAASYGYVWGKDVIIFRRAANPGVRQVSMGYTFRCSPGFQVRSWDEPARGKGGEMIQAEVSDDEKIVAADVAYLIKAAVA